MNQRTVLLLRSGELGWREVRDTLARMPDCRIVGETNSPQQALQLVEQLQPHVLFAPGKIPGTKTSSFLSEVRLRSPSSIIALFARQVDRAELLALVAFEHEGDMITDFLHWNDLSSFNLRTSLSAVLDESLIVLSRTVLQRISEVHHGQAAGAAKTISLTDREQAVLKGLAAGFSREEIAAQEFVSPRTIKRTVASLTNKLEAPTPFILGMKAVRLGLV